MCGECETTPLHLVWHQCKRNNEIQKGHIITMTLPKVCGTGMVGKQVKVWPQGRSAGQT